MPADGALDLAVPQRVHIVGIGGAGMSAIASVLAAMGHTVTGSDLKATPVTERLAAQGIAVAVGHRAAQVGPADVVTSSPAVPPSNPELAEAARRGVRVVRRAEMLAAIAATKRCIAVAGTHGKTTTCSMLSLILVEADLRPSFLIGADVNEIGTNAVWDEGEWVVVEADESYGTFEALEPEIAVLTNVEPDHLDHYGTFAALRRAFGDYLAGARGPSIVCADDEEAAALGAAAGSATVGTSEGATYPMSAVELSRSAVAFDLAGPGGPLGRVEVPVPGLHNARNAALAAVAALAAGATVADAVAALARFAGVPRRFEFRGEVRGVTFVDDYAHLPTEVRATLRAARGGGWGRVVAVFQPHRYTRTAALADSFGPAFDEADVVVVTDVYSAGEPPVPGVSGRLVADAVAARRPGRRVVYVPSWEELPGAVAGLLAPGDLCLTLGAGDLTGLADLLQAHPLVVSAPRPEGAAAAADTVAARLGPLAQRDRPLGPLTTYRVGGPAAVFVEAETEDDLLAVRRALEGTDLPVLVVGRGSNLLVADRGFAGLALRLGEGFAAVAVPEGAGRTGGGPVLVRAGGAVALPVLARRVVEAGLTGLEWAVGVPGSVGGAVRMNAGGHGSDTAAALVRYRWLDLAGPGGGEEGPTRLAHGYRTSSLAPSEVVLWAEFALGEGDRERGRAELSEIVRWRRRHQPGGANAGSVFTNPPGDSAGRLVEAAGLKGLRLGTARGSEKHANFIQADEGGSADDVLALMGHVAAAVAADSGVTLESEVRLIGFGEGETGAVSTNGAVPHEPDAHRGAPGRPAPGPPGGRPAPGGAAPAVARRRGRRRLGAVLCLLVVVTVAVAAWYLLHSSLLSAKVLTVTGSAHDPAARVLAVGGLDAHPPLVDVDPGASAAAIERLPWVATAQVTRHWPDGVSVHITERIATATMAGPRGRWVELDPSGRVLASVAGAAPPLRHFSVLGPGGAPLVPGAPGTWLGPRAATGLAVADSLPPSFALQVAGVVVEPGGWVQLQMTTPITVDVGSASQLAAKYEDVTSILAGATLHDGDVIDVSVPDAPTVSGP